MKKRSYVMYSCPETDSNIYYATGFMAPDPFLLIVKNGVRYMVMTDLEIGRAKKQSKVEEVISLSKTAAEIDKDSMPPIEAIIEHLLNKFKMKSFEVPANFPAQIYSYLSKKRFDITIIPDPFFEERAYKKEDEIKKIAHSQRMTEEAMGKVAYILREANIRGKRVYFDGTCITSEYLKRVINVFLMEKNMVGGHTIVACGNDGVDPHNEGSGPIRPNESIIVDIFPRSTDTFYFGDMTRTFVVGKPSEALLRLYDAVLSAQNKALSMIKDGVLLADVHKAVQAVFDNLGYKTEMKNGKMQGFFHSTGHGLGLDIHEPFRISNVPGYFRTGMVQSVEPGLYYYGIGGVRIEDLIVVQKDGLKNLNKFPKSIYP